METKIDKNNWCVNLKETPEGELKELFKKWYYDKETEENSKHYLEKKYEYYGITDGKTWFWVGYEKNNPKEITIDQWYNEIYLKEQRSKSIEVVETTKEGLLVTKADLQQLEERLTKLIKEKLNNKVYVNGLKGDGEPLLYARNFPTPEENKPIWGTHPDWESCRTDRDRYGWMLEDGEIKSFYTKTTYIAPSSISHTKRQLAEIKLMEIAEKWNHGVEIKDNYIYAIVFNPTIQKLEQKQCVKNYILNSIIKFNSMELAEKSIELHKELWMDYFMISE